MKPLYVHSLNTVEKMCVSTIDLQMDCGITGIKYVWKCSTHKKHLDKGWIRPCRELMQKKQIEMLVLVSTI